LLLASAGSAQDRCEQDAGGLCEDDGGVDMEPADAGSDAGVPPPAGGSDGGAGDGGSGVACSCHTESEADEGQRIHVCTQSFDRDVCREFGCERGTARGRSCPAEGVRVCCEMPGRGLQSHLYEDCTHANCESGFREQCREFGGSISQGACEGGGGSGSLGGSDDPDDDDAQGCAVSAPGRRFALPISLGVLVLLGASLRRRRLMPG
jgi:hypothetical protein